jgi:formylglycine-generating enzyme required for sulfatase activity
MVNGYAMAKSDVVAAEPPDMALIPAGAFMMGNSVPEDPDITDAPPVSVYVSAFYMAKYEVTKALWDEVRTWGLANGYTDLTQGDGKAADHPVQSISWYDMVKWCNARSEKEGLTPCYTLSSVTYQTGDSDAVTCNWSASGYRLPTEAEWEKAARGGVSGQRFPWGDTITHSQANYSSDASYSYDVSLTRTYNPIYMIGGSPYTSPVGSFAANGYGLYGMAGNVFERCWDWYLDSYSTNELSDPRGPATGVSRVMRGGSWSTFAETCRAGSRYSRPPGESPPDGAKNIGFRPARSLVP